MQSAVQGVMLLTQSVWLGFLMLDCCNLTKGKIAPVKWAVESTWRGLFLSNEAQRGVKVSGDTVGKWIPSGTEVATPLFSLSL